MYRNELFTLLHGENYLPVDFCTELLVKHRMESDVCRFLFIKKEYERLLSSIHDFYDNKKAKKWLKEYSKYMKKIREVYSKTGKDCNRFIEKNINFLLEETKGEVVIEALMQYKDVPPFYNKGLLDLIEIKGSITLKIEYLEYLTMIYKISENEYYTELAQAYVKRIKDIVKEKYEFLEGIDKVSIENDLEICDLRKRLMKFLESNKKYDKEIIFKDLPLEYMVLEISFILACDRRYSQAFQTCIKELDISLCRSIAEKVYRLYKDSNIFFKLFELYYENDLNDKAIELLNQKADVLPYKKVFKILKETEIMTPKHYEAFSTIFRRIEKLKVESEIHHKLTNLEGVRQNAKNAELLSEGFKIRQDMSCAKCEKPFKSANVHYLYNKKQVYHVYCKP